MKDLSKRRFETIAVHAGHGVDPATGAVTPPIHLSTTFERDADGSYPHGYVYARNHNPNRNGLEAALAALEGGAACAAFSSGLAAVTAILQGLRPGDHVVHATTKYLGGRSDVLGGAVVARADDAAFEEIRTAQLYGGAVPSPFDCWLVMRSLPTLPARMQAHCANARRVAGFLHDHP